MLDETGAQGFSLTAALCCWFILQWTARFRASRSRTHSHFATSGGVFEWLPTIVRPWRLARRKCGVSGAKLYLSDPCTMRSTDMLSSWRVPISGCASNRCT